MAKFAFAVRNCRAKHSTEAEGDRDNKAETSKVYYSEYDGTWGAPATAAVVAELKKKGRLKDPDNELALAVATAAAAASGIAEDTVSYQERVGKAVMQIGMGYHATVAATAKANIVWLDLA